MQSFYDFNAIDIEGSSLSMSRYRGSVVLVVNVASQCAFTSQYEELQKLYNAYSKKGLEILAFPCNQFKEQESGSNQEIESFCSVNYGITFPLFQKIDVNGTNTHALYQFLKKEVKGFLGTESIKWNFTKFLIDRDGNVVKRYASMTNPQDIKEDIKELLKEFIINVE